MADYDVIVVGAGPTGLIAAGQLAKHGVRVLVIDKKVRLDENHRSASGYCFLDQPFNNEIIRSEIFEDEGITRLHYDRTGFSVEYNGVLRGVFYEHMFLDTGKHWQAKSLNKPFYHMFLPSRCLADRFGWAAGKGVQFMTESIVLRVGQSEKQVEVLVRTRGKDRRLTATKLIAADGLSSRVAKCLNANEGRTFFGKGPTIEYEMDGIETPYERGGMIFFGAQNFGGMAGAVVMTPSPHGEKAYRIETMSVLPASSASEIIEYFIHKSPFAHWFEKAEILERSGALVEMMSPMFVPCQKNVLFLGDSAAYAECLYQSATMSGYMGGRCTVDELDGKPGFDRYVTWWQESFEWVKNPKRMADYTKGVLFPRFFTVRELDFLFELSEKYPIVVDEPNATPYDFTLMVMQGFMAMPEVPDTLKQRMQMVIDADMTDVVALIGKVQEA
ncbi:MAG: NAD(P)/FAD-dependent oxidoreductase [Deltaproteobacteria bacterium]|nr:NAD(P)/FAD-dependent oxidoreductase [Deltaproteobacteria bacterium]